MIELVDVSKEYHSGAHAQRALNHVNLQIEEGDFLAVMGPSGSGKSTLLKILGCMDRLTEGEYKFQDIRVDQLGYSKIEKFRKTHVSYVFQQFALIKHYTLFENIEIPLNARSFFHRRRKTVIEIAERLGISDVLHKYPGETSGGQQQRCAIARALVMNNPLILADEPTGALDQKTGEEIMKLMKEINDSGKTIVLVTHDEKVAAWANKTVMIEDGKLQVLV